MICVVDLGFLPWSSEVNVPVVGGHAGITILPLFSQVSFYFSVSFSFVFVPFIFCICVA